MRPVRAHIHHRLQTFVVDVVVLTYYEQFTIVYTYIGTESKHFVCKFVVVVFLFFQR